MKPRPRWAAALAALLIMAAALPADAARPAFTEEVTDFGRNRWRTHYTPTEPEYPLESRARPVFEVPLGLSRSQPLVVSRDFDSDGTPEPTIFHIAGDRLWALRADTEPKPREQWQSAESYRAYLRQEGFIRWEMPVELLCASGDLKAADHLLASKCRALGPRREQRPFASSHAAYSKGTTPADDVIYVGFGHPAALVAIRATDGKILGGYIVEAGTDRGLVGAPLVFPGDVVVIGTTGDVTTGDVTQGGQVFIVRGLTRGTASVRGLQIGGRISFSPVPVGSNSFIIASDARWDADWGTHGYMMAYQIDPNTRIGGPKDFAARWPAAVVTPAGIPGEAAIDDQTVYFADKYGKLFALRVENGELLWCRQFPGLGPCTSGGNPQPAFINSGPGIDEDNVYFAFRNNQGPNKGPGQVVALNKGTGQLVWQQPMDFPANTSPVPMEHIVIVGDTGGYVRAFDKKTGEPVSWGGYPLQLSDEPYRSGDQKEHWWEPIGGTATQMAVAAELMLVGVNSQTEERTVLKAFKLHPLPDLTLTTLDVPAVTDYTGFEAKVRAICRSCIEPVTTSVSLKVGSKELPRQPVTFRPENGYSAVLSWQTGTIPVADAKIRVVATVDPDDAVSELDETNNSLWATVEITIGTSGLSDDEGFGSKLTD